MKITGSDLYGYNLPLTNPLTLKGKSFDRREGLLLRLEGTKGATGWGEAAPLPGFSSESLEDAIRELSELAASMVGREINDDSIGADGTLARELDSMNLAPSVRFGFETAAWNVYAATHGVTLPEVFSPHARTIVPVNGLLTGSPTEVLNEARRMRSAGYEAVKLKVGGRSVEEEVGLVRAVREALGEDVSLRLDANQAWSFEEGSSFARGVWELGIEYIEEPLTDPAGLGEFARICSIPVALDESLAGMVPEALEKHHYAGAVVLKPGLLGGVSRTLRLAARALEFGMRPVISSAYETGVGTAALVALAAGIGDEEIPAGLDTYRRLAEDMVEPRLRLPAPRLDVSETVASGRGVVRSRLIHIGTHR